MRATAETKPRNILGSTLGVALLLTLPATAETIFVDAAAPDGGDGSSWSAAFTDLQDALAQATASDEIWVARGVYLPDEGSGDPNVAFSIPSGVEVYGGFAGDENALHQRQLSQNPVVLSGDLDGDGTLANNACTVVVFDHADESTVIDGFVIAGGHAGAAGCENAGGGGMRVIGGAPIVRRCTVTENATADAPLGSEIIGGPGAGVLVSEGGQPTFIQSAITHNTAGSAGNFQIDGADCGGGLVPDTTFIRCTIADNRAGRGGPETDQGFDGGDGGGLCGDRIVLINCAVTDNRAGSGGDSLGWPGDGGEGGGLYGEDLVAVNTLFASNHPGESGWLNCGCTEGFAGAVYGGGTFVSCTFFHNVLFSSPLGYAILATDAVTVRNSVASGHVSDFVEGSAEISYSCLEGGWPGVGNVDADPMLIDPENGDYRLSPDSPCINAGDPEFVPVLAEDDLAGHPRILCDRVDIGALEFGLGDYDCNRVVDLFDYAAHPACHTGPDGGPYDAGCEAFDADTDQDIDFADFASFQRLSHPAP